MRMRKKKNLIPRMERCGRMLISDPKSMRGRWRELYPEANITPIDYDPSATRVNQENRIKLMLAVARERLTAGTAPAEEKSPAAVRPVRRKVLA